MSKSINEINANIRKAMVEQRLAMPEYQWVWLSNIICNRIWETHCSNAHVGVFLTYYATRNEPKLSYMHERLLKQGHELYFPVVEGDDIKFYFAQSPADFSKGTFGLMEPTERLLKYDESESALCFVPGVAFSENGDRIGFGRGYYDRFLATHPEVRRVGICYDFQITNEIRPKETDIAMDTIITETRILHFERKK